MDCRRPGSSVLGILQARILSGLPRPLPGYILNSGIKLACLLHCRWILDPLSHLGSLKWLCNKGLYPRLQCALKWVTVPFFLSVGREMHPRDQAVFSEWHCEYFGIPEIQVAVVQSLSCVQPFVTPWTVAHQASLSFTISQSLPKPLSIDFVMPSYHLILRCPLLLPSIFLSIRVSSNESALRIRWPNNWNFSFASVLPVNIQGWFPLGLTGLISLPSKGLSRVLQHHSSEASVLWCSAFFIVQLSHLNMTTGKTIALTRWTFVGKVMCLLFNMLSRLVITFLPPSKGFFILWLQSPSAVILEP